MKDGLEIERVYLLASMPAIPCSCESWTIEQGYLEGRDGAPEGRLRRTTLPCGTVLHHFNCKTGTGLVRQEVEREIDAAEFEMGWQRTSHRRVRKVRHRVPVGDLIWEIDQFLDFPLVMAEVELPSPEHRVEAPSWVRSLIVREVTEDPRYRNSQLAMRGPPPQ